MLSHIDGECRAQVASGSNASFGGHFQIRSGLSAAGNIGDQRVVEPARLLVFIDHPTDLVVGVGSIGCKAGSGVGDQLMDSMELAMFMMPKSDPFGIAIMGLGVFGDRNADACFVTNDEFASRTRRFSALKQAGMALDRSIPAAAPMTSYDCHQ